MHLNEVDSLTDFLYDIANKIVGNVGKNNNDTYSVTGEEYIEFATFFIDKDEVLRKWIEWIGAYKSFAQHVFSGKIRDNNQPLAIYWRSLPEIDQDKNSNRYSLYARLLISSEKEVRLPHNP
jgi:hypothetical protein